MIPIQDFIAELNALEIKVWVDPNNGQVTQVADAGVARLCCKAPKGVLTPILKEQLSARKAEIIAYLQRHSPIQPPSQAIAEGIQPALLPEPRTGLIPLSFAQQRIWFLDRLEGSRSTDYNVPWPFQLEGHLNAIALENTLLEIIRRHEILRTNFQIRGEEVQQIIKSEIQFDFPLVDLQYLDKSAKDAEVERLLLMCEKTPFNLTFDPLIRATLVRRSPQSHVLLLSFHHIVFDGWSAGVFIRELITLYQAFCTGQPSPLPALSIQYADYAIWQRRWLQSAELDCQLEYWKQQFAELPPPLELPSTPSYKPGEPVRGCRETFQISKEDTQKLRQLSRELGATLFMTVMAAYAVLLYRYSTQEDLTIGVPVANRNRIEIEPLIGFFVNTLALRINLQGNPSFLTLVARVRQTVLSAQEHQDLPFDKLVEILQPDRDRSHSPLFRVMFVLQREVISQQQLGDITIKTLPTTQATETFDLTLFVTEGEQELLCTWEYDGNRFEKCAIARMTGHLQTLLRGILADPAREIGQLALLTAREWQQLTSKRSLTMVPDYRPLVPALFEACVEAAPGAIAVEFEGKKLTYHVLNARANQLAHYLQNQGVGPETLVGLCIERSHLMIVGLLGILKAGGAYVPIDPAYPSDRITYILEDTQVNLVISQGALAPKLSQAEVSYLLLDTDWEMIGQQPTVPPINRANGHNLAYVIYTSGSTGKPKGVAIEHQSLASFTQSAIAAYGIATTDRILQFASISFDVAVEEIYLGLCAGATLVLRTEEMIASIAQFWQQCQDWEITVLDLPTAYWHLLMADLTPDSTLPPALRLAIIGGEQALPGPWKKWQKWHQEQGSQEPQGPVPQLVNTYGPTETTVVATLYQCENLAHTSTHSPNAVPIGSPLSPAEVYVLDGHQQPVPVGVPGELYIGGAGLARGYLNQPELTAERFIPNPFAEDGSRLYKTGDRVRYLPDGNLEYLGRIDNQVKLRGFRIELGEIEAALTLHPQVREAAVQVVGAPPQQRLIAFVVPRTIGVSHRELQSFLKQKLPNYMIPATWMNLEALPLSPHGKVDRHALPKPPSNSDRDRALHMPRNRLELELAQIWSEVLNVRPIGVQDNFFNLGGHSLLGVSLMARIRQAFGRALPLTSLFQDGTIEQQAVLLQQDHPAEWSPLVTFRTTGNQPPLFCVHPGGGSTLNYVHLAQHLSPERPFYGLEARGFDSGQTPHELVENMAADYLEAIQAIQPQGPYHLAGWCFGGLVAFEIALQLKQQGQTVAFVGLLDIFDFCTSEIPNLPEPPGDDISYFIDLFGNRLTHCQQSVMALPLQQRFPYLLEQAKQLSLVPPTFDMPEALRLVQVGYAHDRALLQYFPQKFPGKITIVQAQEGITVNSDRGPQGWEQLAETVELHFCSGDHRSMFAPPHVQSLAATLERCLTQ